MKRALLVLAVGLSAALPAPASAAAKPFDFEIAPSARGATTSGGDGLTSKPLRTPRRFTLVGFRWAAGGEPRIDVRSRRANGRWSRWTRVPAHADHAPDPGGGEPGGAGASDPVWTGEADYVQYRLSKRLRRLRLHFVNTASAAQARFARRPVARSAQSGQPEIVPRSAWDPGTCPPRSAPRYGEVKAAFIHHTVSTNDYPPEQGPAVVLAICQYHRNSNGWADVGYNFLVDKYGRIYEGRAGGIGAAVVGAQAQGYNGQTTGIASVGNHHPPSGGVPETNEALDAMARLIRWKLPVHGQPTSGTVQVTSAGGGSNHYPAGSVVTLDRVPGHRDGNSTACPGDALYWQLPDLRARIGNVQPTTSTPQPARMTINRESGRVSLGKLVLLTGTIDPPKGEVWVRAERKIRGRYRRVAGVRFRSRDGQIKKRFRPEHKAIYRFRFSFAGDAANTTSASRWVYVRTVKPNGGAQAPD